MKEDILIDLVLENYNVKSTPEVRDMIRDFIHCDLDWFKQNFVEEQNQVDENDRDYENPEDECHNRLCDYSLCDKHWKEYYEKSSLFGSDCR